MTTPMDAPKPPVDTLQVDTPVTPTFKGFDADEGGEVRMEYIKFPNGGIGARTTAFFFKDVGTTKYHDFLSLNGCTDMSALDKWPMAMNPIGERDYYDVGRVILSGGTNAYEIPRRTVQARDPFFREHPANDWYFDPAVNTDSDGGNFISEKTRYDVILTGSAEFPPAIFDDAIYVPAAFDLTAPTHAGPVDLPAATDQTFTFTTPTDTPPAGYILLSLVGFTGGSCTKGPAVVCIEPNDGSITVPGAMIDKVRTACPTGGTIARQTLTHVVRELVDASGPTGKRVDLLGVWCYASTPFNVP
jgi:hypothetical protein